MNNPTHEFHGYTLVGRVKSTFYTAVESDQSVILVLDGSIYATIQFVNNGLNVHAPKGTRNEDKKIIIL